MFYESKSGSRLPVSSRRSWTNRVPYLLSQLVVFVCLVGKTSGQVAMFDSQRLKPDGLITEPEAHASSLDATLVVSTTPIVASQATTAGQAILLADEAKGAPPVYKSAPKHVNELGNIGAPKEATSAKAVEARGNDEAKLGDLYSAGSYKKKKHPIKKYKVVIVKKEKTKKRKKKVKKVKKVIVKIEKVKRKKKKPKKYQHSRHSAGSSPSTHRSMGGKYYEYRSVPKKGSWKFGFKRGNKKHAIERKEEGKKWQFRTEVKWTDKSGKGHHVFDYNHHKGKHHHAAASSSVAHKAPAKGAKRGRKLA